MLWGIGHWNTQCEMGAATRFAVLAFRLRRRLPVHTTEAQIAVSATNKALLKAESIKFA